MPPSSKKSDYSSVSPWPNPTNPREELKRVKTPLGNIHLEIITHLSAIHEMHQRQRDLQALHLPNPVPQRHRNLERRARGHGAHSQHPAANHILHRHQSNNLDLHPHPFVPAVQVAGWVTIPASVFAAYIILGITLIGREI